MDKYDTPEYSWVKATAVSVHLRIYLCTFKNTNKLSGTVVGETVTEPTNYTKLSKKIIRQSRRFSKLKPV